MKKQEIMILPYSPGSIKLTDEQTRALFTPEEITRGEIRGELKTFGPWQIPVSFTALCCSNHWDRSKYPHTHGPLHVYGKRTLSRPQQSGYELEGRVSIGGKKYRGFTSSQSFELPGGKLVNVSIIHACGIVPEPTV